MKKLPYMIAALLSHSSSHADSLGITIQEDSFSEKSSLYSRSDCHLTGQSDIVKFYNDLPEENTQLWKDVFGRIGWTKKF